MLSRRPPGALIVVLALLAAPAARADEPAPAGEPTTGDSRDGAGDGAATPPAPPLTTGVWRPPTHYDLAWQLLALPEYAVQLAFTPVALLVTAVERYRLDRRTYDLLRNDAGTIVVTPDIKLAGGEGFGGGATLSLERVADGELDIGALGRINGDYELELEYEKALVFAEGRELVALVYAERDQNLRYYGIGNDTSEDDKRVLESNLLDASITLDLTPAGVLDVTGLIEIGLHRESLQTGSDPTVPGVAEDPGDTVMPPPDFDQTLSFGRFRAELLWDTRDVEGRPTRGAFTQIGGTMVQEITGESFSSFQGDALVGFHVPVLPDKRTILFAAGVSATLPFRKNDAIPLHSYSVLGRKNHLRGFSRFRFRDQHAWWASTEYRFPVYEYLNTGGAIDAMLFFDAGRVAGNLEDLFSSNIHWAPGVGLRGGYDAGNFFSLELGYSSEGLVLGLELGKDL